MNAETPQDSDLLSLSQLVERQQALEDAIERQEEDLAQLKETYRNLTEGLIPDKMTALGMEKMSLSDGTKVEIKAFYAASILDPEKCFAWLRTGGFGSLIKREVKCLFGMGEDEKAESTASLLRARGLTPEDKSSVHPSTLKSFVREQVESGHPIPSELMSVHIGKRSKLTLPKAK